MYLYVTFRDCSLFPVLLNSFVMCTLLVLKRLCLLDKQRALRVAQSLVPTLDYLAASSTVSSVVASSRFYGLCLLFVLNLSHTLCPKKWFYSSTHRDFFFLLGFLSGDFLLICCTKS